MIVAGIDPSLTSTGVAVVDTQDRLTIATHTVASKGRRDASWRERWERGVDLAADIGALVPRDSELVVVEAPTLSQGRQGGHLDRHGLWWALYGNLTRAGHDVLVVPASSRAKYATGRGNAGKDEVLLAVSRRYPQAPIVNNDQADAVALAAMGARLLGEPIEDSLPKAHLDALAKLALPTSGP